MFDEHDPLLARLRPIALAMPEAEERVSHGRPWFHHAAGPGFAVYGCGAAGALTEPRPHALLVHVDEEERPARRQDPRFFVPPYIGGRGWLGLDLDDVDWTEVAELVDASWRFAAPRRLLR